MDARARRTLEAYPHGQTAIDRVDRRSAVCTVQGVWRLPGFNSKSLGRYRQKPPGRCNPESAWQRGASAQPLLHTDRRGQRFIPDREASWPARAGAVSAAIERTFVAATGG